MGTPPSFDAIFMGRRRALSALAFQRLGNQDDVEDALQETYMKGLSVDWSAIENPDAMLTTIFLNVVCDIGRRRKRGAFLFETSSSEVLDAPSPGPDPEQALAGRQRWNALCHAVDKLPPTCRKVFLMCKIDNLSHADICAATGLSRASVEKHIVRALLRLRKEVSK